MQNSKFVTLSINSIGDKTATIVASAPTIVQRAEVKNVGAGVVFLATDVGDVNPQTGPSAGAYRLRSGEAVVFVLAPKQSLNAIAPGAGAMVSVANSDAIPLDSFRS